MKRVLSFVLAVLMCLSLLPLGALAEEVEEAIEEEEIILEEPSAEPEAELAEAEEDPAAEFDLGDGTDVDEVSIAPPSDDNDGADEPLASAGSPEGEPAAAEPVEEEPAGEPAGEPELDGVTGNGIAGNGTGNISINIYGSPYEHFADSSAKGDPAKYAYGPQGCAWFAGARAYEITGVDCVISSGERWFNERYAWYGFKAGWELPSSGKALACYANHVSVIECLTDDGMVVVSEGGITSYANNDYCLISKKTKTEVTSNDFLGFVYLYNPPTYKATVDKSTCFAGEQVTISSSRKYDYYVLRIYYTPAGGQTSLYWEGQVTSPTYSATFSNPGYYSAYFLGNNSTDETSTSVGWSVTKISAPEVTASVNGTSVDLDWTDVGASSYYMYVENRDTGNIHYSNNLEKWYHSQLVLAYGKYRAYVTAVYSEDVMKSGYVDFELADPNSGEEEMLATPVISSVVNIADGIEITWSAVAGAAKYRVFRKVGTGNWSKVADVTTSSCVDKLVESGTSYTYTVRCLASDGQSYTSDWDRTGKTITRIPVGAAQNGWVQAGSDWVYYENGVMVTNAWQKDSVGWCYLGANGYMVKSKWVQDGGCWYYLNASGYMVTGWQKIGGEWYYFYSPSGKMAAKAWVKDSTGWLYMNASGKITKNAWAKDSVGWCYLGSDGYMVTNKWQKDSKGWCYLGDDGRMYISKWLKDGNYWYYLDDQGYMVTGWKQIGEVWYYFYGSGRMATGTVTIGGKTYKFDSNGKWIK